MSVPQQNFSSHNDTIRDKERTLTNESGASEQMRMQHLKQEREHHEKELAKADLTQKKRIFDQNKLEMERLEFEVRRLQGEIVKTEADVEQSTRVLHISESQAVVAKQEITMAGEKIKKLEIQLQESRRESTRETGRAIGGTLIEKESAHKRKKEDIERLKVQVRKLQEEITREEMEEKQLAAAVIETKKHSEAHAKNMGEVTEKVRKLELEILQSNGMLSKLKIFFERNMAEKQHKEMVAAAKKAALLDLQAKKKRDAEAMQHLKNENNLINHQIQLLEQKAR